MGYQTLQGRILLTYNSLRFGMFVITTTMPIVVVLWGYIFGVPWQNSVSEYYFALPTGGSVQPTYPCRVPFVGILFALGSFLYLYKGFSSRENIALNLAGLCALGVALCPMRVEPGYIPSSNILHFTFAVLMFICMAYTAIFCHNETLRWVRDADRRLRFKTAYYIIGWFMGLFPLTGIILAKSVDAVGQQVFWIEAAGTWAFAAYWFTKSLELKESEVELKMASRIVRA